DARSLVELLSVTPTWFVQVTGVPVATASRRPAASNAYDDLVVVEPAVCDLDINAPLQSYHNFSDGNVPDAATADTALSFTASVPAEHASPSELIDAEYVYARPSLFVITVRGNPNW